MMGQMAEDPSVRTRRKWPFVAIALAILVGLVVGAVVGIVGYRAMLTKEPADMTVWLSNPVTPNQVDALTTEIASWPEVTDVRFVSELERYDRLKRAAGSLHLMEWMHGNPFSPSFEVTLSQPVPGLEVLRRLEEAFEPGLVDGVGTKY